MEKTSCEGCAKWKKPDGEGTARSCKAMMSKDKEGKLYVEVRGQTKFRGTNRGVGN
jgi:hypothetical protein